MGTDAGIRTKHYPLDTLDTQTSGGGGKLIS